MVETFIALCTEQSASLDVVQVVFCGRFCLCQFLLSEILGSERSL
jgi:hypothetical protein